MKFAKIEKWMLPSSPDVYSIASVMELAGLSGQWIRIKADDQKKMFGYAPFGKQNVRVSGSMVEVHHKVCFGTDYAHSQFSFTEIANLVKQQKKIRAA